MTPQPRDMYDITKRAAEDLCQHFARAYGLATICLRTSRFFPEAVPLMAFYRLYRGVDVRDVASAHVLAVSNQEILFDVFNISAQSPFEPSDLPALLHDALRYSGARFPKRSLSLLSKVGRYQEALIGSMSLNERVTCWGISPSTTFKRLSNEGKPLPRIHL